MQKQDKEGCQPEGKQRTANKSKEKALDEIRQEWIKSGQ